MARKHTVDTFLMFELKADGVHAREWLHANRPDVLQVPVKYNGRLKVLGGRARFDARTLHPKRIEIARAAEGTPDLREIALHEIAHVVAGYHPVNDGHTKQWRATCKLLGLENPRRFAPLPSLEREQKLVAHCPGCGQQWHRTRYYKQRGHYSCPRCGGDLVTKRHELLALTRSSKR